MPTVGEPTADVWVMAFDPSGHRAVKLQYAIDDADFDDDKWTARIASSTLDDAAAVGTLADARWDCRSAAAATSRSGCCPTARTRPGSRPPRRWSVTRWHGSMAPWKSRDAASTRRLDRQHRPQLGNAAHASVCVRAGVRFPQRPGFDAGDRHGCAALGPVLLPGVTLLVFRHEGQQFALRSARAACRPTAATHRSRGRSALGWGSR